MATRLQELVGGSSQRLSLSVLIRHKQARFLLWIGPPSLYFVLTHLIFHFKCRTLLRPNRY